MAHTQGPWNVWTDERNQHHIANDNADVAEVDGIADIYMDNQQAEGNSRLIAAAPALLDACQKSLLAMIALGNDLNWDSNIPQGYADAINAIRAAIALAEAENENK